MKKAIFSLLLMAASVIGASAQGSATTAQNPQDVDVLYAKNLLAVGTEAPAFPALKKGTWTVLDFIGRTSQQRNLVGTRKPASYHSYY